MLKRITIVVLLIVFAKPIYDFAKPYVGQALQSNLVATFLDEAPALIEQIPELVQSVQSEPKTEQISNEMIQPVDANVAEAPSTVTSYEELVHAIYYYTARYEPNFQIEYKGSTTNIEQMINDVYNEIKKQDEYVYYHLMKRNISYSYTSRRATITFQHDYLTTYEQERYVNGKVQAIIETMPDGLSTYEKVKYVNDWIVQNTMYGEYSTASPHSAYAVAMEGVGVCQGYALLVTKLLNELQVPSQYVVGEVESEAHAWNLVQINGNWYHLDVTWNDPLPDRGNKVRYDYFLKSDIHMSVDHTWEQSHYPTARANYE